jgi:hypothetical protein
VTGPCRTYDPRALRQARPPGTVTAVTDYGTTTKETHMSTTGSTHRCSNCGSTDMEWEPDCWRCNECNRARSHR